MSNTFPRSVIKVGQGPRFQPVREKRKQAGDGGWGGLLSQRGGTTFCLIRALRNGANEGRSELHLQLRALV